MAVLRPMVEIEAAAVREQQDREFYELEQTCLCPNWQEQTDENQAVRFVPCREGKYLYAPVKRRFFYARKPVSRQAGFNHGRKVTYRDDV